MRNSKGKLRRLLAGLLAVCMIVSCMPLVHSAAEEPVTLYYNFLKLCLRRENGFNTPEAIEQANKGVDVTTVTDLAMTTKGNAAEINKNADNYGVPTGATDPWCYVGAGGGGRFLFVSYSYAMQMRGAVGGWASIKVQVPRKALYDVYSVHGYWTNSPIVRIYIAPENAANPRAEEYAINHVDAYPADGKSVFNVETLMGNVSLDSGNYIVSYEIIGKNANAGDTIFCVSGLKLKETNAMPTLSVSGSNIEVDAGAEKEVALSARWSNNVAYDLYGTEVTVTPKDSSVATVEVVTGLTGKSVKITGKKSGTTDVDILVKKGGTQLAAGTMKVTVVGEEPREPINLYYNFFKLCLRRENGFSTPEAIAQANKGVDVTTVTDLAMTTKGNAAEINKNADNYGVPTGATDPWCYVGAGGGGRFLFVSYSYAMQMRDAVGGWASIKVQVPRKALYDVYSVHGYWTNSPIVRIYIAPENAANPRAEEYAINHVDAYPANGKSVFNVETLMGNVFLDSGNYIVSYEIAGKNANAGDTIFCVSGLKLKEVEAAPTLSVSAQDTEAPIGGNAIANVSAAWSNGVAYDLYGADVTASAKDPSLVDVEVIKTATGKKIQLAGKLNGTTQIDVTVKKDGKVIGTCAFNVNVTGTPPKQYLNLDYNFLKLCLRRENGFSTPEAIAQHNKGVDVTTVTDFAMTTKGDPAEINKNADKYGVPTGATDPWHYVRVSNGATFKFVSSSYAMQVGGSIGGRAQFKIKVPQDGVYTAYSVHGYWANSSAIRVYLAPEDAEDPAAVEYLLNHEDTYVPAAQQKFNIEVPYKTVELKAGDYIVTYETIGQNELSGGTQFCLQAFRLKEVDAPAELGEFTAETVPTQPVGAQVKSQLRAVMSDGSLNTFIGMTIEAAVKDASIASAEVADNDFGIGKHLKINTLAPGKTEIKITVKKGDAVFAEYTLPLTVSDGNSPVKSIVLSLRKANVAVGKFTTATVTATLEDGLVKTLANSELTFTVDNSDVAQVSADGKITAIKEGTAKITATYKGGITSQAEVTVIKREIIFNYLKLDYRMGSGMDKPALHNTGVPLGSVVSFDMTTEGHEKEVNPASTYSTEPWHYLGTDKATFNFVSSVYALQIRISSIGSWGAIKIRVPFDGVYQAISEEGYWAHSPIVRYYLAPADAENPIDPKYSIGINDTYVPAAQQKFNVKHPLDIVELTAGDYIVTYQVVGKNKDSLDHIYCVTSFGLEPVSEMPTFTLRGSTPKAANPGIPAEITVDAVGSNGATDALYDAQIRAEAKDPSVCDVSVAAADISSLGRSVVVVGKKPGTTDVIIYVTRNGEELSPITVPVTVKTPVMATMTAEMERTHLNLNRDPVQVVITALDPDGDPISISPENCSFTSSDESVATVDENGIVTPHSEGRSEIGVSVTFGGKTLTDSISITAGRSKVSSTYYTDAKRAAALKNAEIYSWGRAMRDAAVRQADKYVNHAEKLWEMVPGEGIPRAITVGLENDPDAFTCRYCNVDIRKVYGSYAWLTDAMNDPWKIQCPGCRRKFPSNDFGGFYKLGLNEHGIFDYQLAHERNQELVDAGQPGYLKNILYPEALDMFGDANWGVDDGWGYRTGRNYSNGVAEVHTYIAWYMHYGLWHADSYGTGGTLVHALTSLRDAYLYTGEIKYGRTGAILLDRIADVWPDFSLMQYFKVYYNSHGGSGEGKIVGREWEAMNTAPVFALAYDAFYPLYEDEQIISFLSKKAEQYNLKNDKSSAELIRRNAEDGILREIFRAVKKADIHGNFGVHQNTLSIAAVVLDSMPETGEMIDWLMQSGTKTQGKNTGGDMLRTYIDLVDRDGHGNESAPGYNRIWMESSITVGETLANYTEYSAADLFANPKVEKMMTSFAAINLLGQGVPAIGDAGKAGGKYYEQMNLEQMVTLYNRTGNPDYARLAWYLNGDSAKDICTDIFVQDPEKLGERIKKEVEVHGEWDFNKSSLLSGYGFAALRGGKAYDTATLGTWDVQRDFWMYFGGANTSHKHMDGLYMGIDAYGVSIAPDLGYPEATGTNPNRYQWVNTTISHNTVVVNEKEQSRNVEAGFPLHYDDGDRVKLVDVSLPEVYSDVDEYRRTIVTVDVDGEVSYGVDFFRVTGGQDHLYSFHALSNEVSEYTGFEPVTQVGGSYAGADVPWGEDPYTVSTSITVPLKFPKGYTWLKNVRRADAPATGEFAVDFKIMNHNDAFPRAMDLHLRMTMVNDFNLNEITLADGVPPRTGGNPDELTYVLARRKGNNLNTLFTTVYEPYVDERYISSIEQVKIEAEDGVGSAKAIKVVHVDGRTDYIMYSEDNSVLYKVTDGDVQFFFRGFLGVYTVSNGAVVYRYLNDGDVLGERDNTTRSEITGTVYDFSKELVKDNLITAAIAGEVEAEQMIGRQIYVENDGKENAVYPIEGAEDLGDGKWQLHLGNHTLIRSLKDANNVNGGYVYNIAEGQSFRIPLSVEESSGVVVSDPDKLSASAGRKMTYTINAVSAQGNEISYSANYLPRGASLSESGMITWTPDNSQIGEHIFSVTVNDGTIEDTVYIPVEVFKSTAGSGSTTSGGSTSGGTTSGSTTPSGTTKPDPTPSTPSDSTETDGFKDLGGYDWAKDAIENLADKGVVNGTGNNTFSPSKNITRADFALMMVRAFGLESDSTENFADVPANAYYAEALAIGKAHGIINGVGENKYNPTETITRQDMMTVVSRALKALGYELEAADDQTLAAFIDAAEIADYATEHVAVMVANGLIKGKSETTIAPKEYTTRAEVAVLIERLISAFLSEEK